MFSKKTFVLMAIALAALLVMGLPVLAQDDAPPTIALGGNDELGQFLVGANGMTLYTFGNDEPGVTNCYDQCAVNWPPLLVAEDETPTLAEGLSGRLDVITRDDGGLQVTYNDEPLYYWINDEKPGDATGHLVGDVWFIVAP